MKYKRFNKKQHLSDKEQLMIKSKTDKLLERLQKEGRVTQLTDEEIRSIDEHIEADMKEFRAEMYRRESKPHIPIILNA